RGLFHFGLERVLHFLALAGKEIARGLDLVEVLVARNVIDAGRGAIFQVGIEAMAIIAFRRRERTAAAQVKLPPDQRERAAERAGVGEWAEIPGAVVLLEPREREA